MIKIFSKNNPFRNENPKEKVLLCLPRDKTRNKCYFQGTRTGFAECAKDAGVPIFPMFTSNVRQVFDFPERLKGNTLRQLYEYTRLPFSLLFGGFPAKLDTYIGDPIETDDLSVAEIKQKSAEAIEKLIVQHQKYRDDWWTGLFYSLKSRFKMKKT